MVVPSKLNKNVMSGPGNQPIPLMGLMLQKLWRAWEQHQVSPWVVSISEAIEAAKIEATIEEIAGQWVIKEVKNINPK
jgi:hypothetical protein